MKSQSKQKLSFKNPVIAAQVLESPFVADARLGHTMPPGKDFIGEKEYLGWNEAIEQIKRSKKKVILNIGDSSTSGWDSNIVTQNRKRLEEGKPLLPAFFQYKTYSDVLFHLVEQEYYVLNAGVPAHTSFQGSLRLKTLLKSFQREGISIAWVTAYYGNNDSVWDHNRQDKEWVGKSSFRQALTRFWNRLKENNKDSVVTRVSESDYQNAMKAIIQTCQEFAVPLIVIEPITPIYWKPGTRVLHEDLERSSYPGSQKVYPMLDHALELWNQALRQKEYSDLKRVALEEARENDYIVPRIKKGHLAVLRAVIREAKVPYVQVSVDRTEDDICNFIDYCHPIGKANEFIAEEIAAIVLGKKSGKSLSAESGVEAFTSKKPTGIELPTDHYTLY